MFSLSIPPAPPTPPPARHAAHPSFLHCKGSVPPAFALFLLQRGKGRDGHFLKKKRDREREEGENAYAVRLGKKQRQIRGIFSGRATRGQKQNQKKRKRERGENEEEVNAGTNFLRRKKNNNHTHTHTQTHERTKKIQKKRERETHSSYILMSRRGGRVRSESGILKENKGHTEAHWFGSSVRHTLPLPHHPHILPPKARASRTLDFTLTPDSSSVVRSLTLTPRPQTISTTNRRTQRRKKSKKKKKATPAFKKQQQNSMRGNTTTTTTSKKRM